MLAHCINVSMKPLVGLWTVFGCKLHPLQCRTDASGKTACLYNKKLYSSSLLTTIKKASRIYSKINVRYIGLM